MARGKSVKLLAAIPERYTPDFMERLDRRTVLGRAVFQRYHAIASDLGGVDTLSHIKIGVMKRFIWLECVIEGIELQLAAGEQIDIGAYTQLINSWIGLARQLGLERRRKPVPSISDYVAAKAGAGE